MSKLLKTAQYVIIMFCLSYFTGLVWYVFCKLEISKDGGFLEHNEFDLRQSTNFQRIASLTYFLFTTLSTVGLGDFHPVTNSERILCSIIMLFGVMLTSLMIENLNNMVAELRALNKSMDDSGRLHLFLSTIKKLNGDAKLQRDLEFRIEDYFRFRWEHDRNLAVSTQDDFRLYN